MIFDKFIIEFYFFYNSEPTSLCDSVTFIDTIFGNGKVLHQFIQVTIGHVY